MIGAALLAAALAGSGLPGMGNIVVTVPGKAALPGAAKPLGKTGNRAWAAWPAEQAVSAPCDSSLRLAYLDENDFRRETGGLSPSQVAEVMRKRAGANSQYLSDMSDGLALETGRIGAWINDSAALDIFRDGYFTGRFINENLQDFEDLVREWNGIHSLENDLLARKDCPPALAESMRRRDAVAPLLHLEKAAAFSDQSRADLKRREAYPLIIYARALPPGLAARVDNRDFVVDKAGKGYLIPQTPDEIAKLPPSMHPIVVFLDAAASARAVRLWTPAQLEQRVAGIVAQGGVSPRDYQAAILDARLRMLATLRQCLVSAKFNLPPASRGEMEAAYALILGETHQDAIDLLGPSDPAKGRAHLADSRLRIRILNRFAAASGDAGLIAWTQRASAALEPKP